MVVQKQKVITVIVAIMIMIKTLIIMIIIVMKVMLFSRKVFKSSFLYFE